MPTLLTLRTAGFDTDEDTLLMLLLAPPASTPTPTLASSRHHCHASTTLHAVAEADALSLSRHCRHTRWRVAAGVFP